MTLDNLLRIGKLKQHAASKVEIARLMAAAQRALADARIAGLSSDARLDFAYRASCRPHWRSSRRSSRPESRSAVTMFPECGHLTWLQFPG